MKKWFKKKLLHWAAKIVINNGLLIVEIVEIAGTNYIRSADGALHRIGGKK